MARPSMDDYVDVAERIAQFKERHPEGTLQTVSIKDVEVGGKAYIEVWAHAYRDREDTRPGIGHAREPFPGTTNFTRQSESMNAETSAWGRAIVALGFATKRDGSPGVASRQEVRNRQAEQETETTAPTPPKQSVKDKPLNLEQYTKVLDRLNAADQGAVELNMLSLGIEALQHATVGQAQELLVAVGA